MLTDLPHLCVQFRNQKSRLYKFIKLDDLLRFPFYLISQIIFYFALHQQRSTEFVFRWIYNHSLYTGYPKYLCSYRRLAGTYFYSIIWTWLELTLHWININFQSMSYILSHNNIFLWIIIYVFPIDCFIFFRFCVSDLAFFFLFFSVFFCNEVRL